MFEVITINSSPFKKTTVNILSESEFYRFCRILYLREFFGFFKLPFYISWFDDNHIRIITQLAFPFFGSIEYRVNYLV